MYSYILHDKNPYVYIIACHYIIALSLVVILTELEMRILLIFRYGFGYINDNHISNFRY